MAQCAQAVPPVALPLLEVLLVRAPLPLEPLLSVPLSSAPWLLAPLLPVLLLPPAPLLLVPLPSVPLLSAPVLWAPLLSPVCSALLVLPERLSAEPLQLSAELREPAGQARHRNRETRCATQKTASPFR